jgi:hypothetical protein
MTPTAYIFIGLCIAAIIVPILLSHLRAWHPLLRMRRYVAYHRIAHQVPAPVEETDRPRLSRESELLRRRQQEAVEEANEWLRATWRARFK